MSTESELLFVVSASRAHSHSGGSAPGESAGLAWAWNLHVASRAAFFDYHTRPKLRVRLQGRTQKHNWLDCPAGGGRWFRSFVVFSRGRRSIFRAAGASPAACRNYKVKSVKRRGKLNFRLGPMCHFNERVHNAAPSVFILYTCLSDASIDQYSQHTANTLGLAFAYWSLLCIFCNLWHFKYINELIWTIEWEFTKFYFITLKKKFENIETYFIN